MCDIDICGITSASRGDHSAEETRMWVVRIECVWVSREILSSAEGKIIGSAVDNLGLTLLGGVS